MTRIHKIGLSGLVALSLFAVPVIAQTPKTPVKATTQKFKPPKLYTYLGNNHDTAEVYLEEALQLVRLPLRITDEKKGPYTISSYQFMYKRIGVKEDEQSGKVSPTTTISSDLFRSSPLPKVWSDNIGGQLKKGEELFFFDIIVKDAAGRLMFAPNVFIKVK